MQYVQKEKLDIWFNGFVRYVDTFKRVHRFEYRFRYHRGWGRFRFWSTFTKPLKRKKKSTDRPRPTVLRYDEPR